ncbi:unnamed protein product [Amoebophrya sp. A25]|nr:unnamed protein product [Amoebophrya sp. A25]|eukprot:GSA25T00015278001.1
MAHPGLAFHPVRRHSSALAGAVFPFSQRSSSPVVVTRNGSCRRVVVCCSNQSTRPAPASRELLSCNQQGNNWKQARPFATMEKVDKTEEEWRQLLNSKEFDVLRKKGTEPPGSGEYDKHYPKAGYYACKGCGFALYSYATKFNSGCGWPAYNACYHSKEANGAHIKYIEDKTHGMVRTEILCKRCGGHLGHVFYGEMGRDSERHCVNSVSVKFVDGPEPANVQTGPLKATL